MKFGEYLRNQKNPEWEDSYLDYDKLKDMIKELETRHVGVLPTGKGTSLSVARPTNAAGMPEAGEGIIRIPFNQFAVISFIDP
jgi:hypothetical protein